jgi:hypothetical protein
MWKRIRSVIGAIWRRFKRTEPRGAVGASLWGVFVAVMAPPGTHWLTTALLVVISLLAIGLISDAEIMLFAEGERNSRTKLRSKEDRADRIEK